MPNDRESRLLADTLFLEILHRAGVERDRRAFLHLVIERETFGFLVHGDDVGLLLHQRLDDGIGVVVAHLVAGGDQVPDFGDGIVLVLAGIGASLDRAGGIELAVFDVHLLDRVGVI